MSSTKVNELIAHLSEAGKEKVLQYVKDLLITEAMQRRAKAALEDVKAGRVITIEQFRENLENWKQQRKN